MGHLIGLVDHKGNIDMRYHQVNNKGEIMTGICKSRPEILKTVKSDFMNVGNGLQETDQKENQ
jgi:hypothetical protein